MTYSYRGRLLATSMLIGVSAIGAPAYAQDAGAAPEIVVTGTRIPSANLESAAPVTVVSSQDFKLQGTTRVEDLLNSLPSVGASQASGVSNGASGTAEVDLRYLGSKRTLALVNGRRLVPGDPNSTTQAADLNFIPSAIVKRAEVLTGGASSVYGADAVAGVVNFIMDDDFEGIRFDGQYGVYQHQNGNPSLGPCAGTNAICAEGERAKVSDILDARGFPFPKGSVADGGSFDGTVSIGSHFDDDRGHAVAYFGYRHVNAVLQARRDFSACVIQNTGEGNPRCGGSATANPGSVVIFAPNSAGVVAPRTSGLGPGTLTVGAPNLFNFAPLNFFQRPDERYIGGVFADYEINERFKPYLEFMFMDDRSKAQIAPGGDFGNTLTINCDNPLMSVAQKSIVCAPINVINGFLGSFPLNQGQGNAGAPIDFVNTVPGGAPYQKAFFQLLRRNTEGGGRLSDYRHTSFRGVLGTKGDLGDAWKYDAYYQYGRTNYSQLQKNEFSQAKLVRALDVVDDPNQAGLNPVCRSFLDGSDPSCVPFDPFTGAAASQATQDYLAADGLVQGTTSERIINVNFTGDLAKHGLKTPWADEGFGTNVGFEYRHEELELNPDEEFQAGDLTGQGAPTLPVAGSFGVFELFAEALMPIVQNRGIHDLTFGAGYRHSWYKLSNGRKYDTDTFKVSLEFAPIRDIRLRAALNRAVRAPNIQELFAQQFVGLDGSSDPCSELVDANNDPRAVSATDFGCLAQGLKVGDAPVGNPAGQYNGLLGGNPNLDPERATTKTLGIILQPRFLPRFALTVDYFNIKVKDAIQGFGADAILGACVAESTASSVSPACSLVQRDPGGSLWLTSGGFVIDTPNNEGKVTTSGVDVNASYSLPIGRLGTLSNNFIGTWLGKYRVDNGLTEPYDCAGLYGPVCSGSVVASSAPMPTWRHKLRSTLQMRNGLGISLGWRMVGKVKAETGVENATIGGGAPVDPGAKIDAQHYFDLATTASIGDHFNLRLGVNNMLDNDPPLVTSGSGAIPGSNLCPAGPCNGNTYPGTWDALGRFFYAGITLDF